MEEGLECEVNIEGIHLEHVSEFKYLRFVLDESDTDGTECSRRVAELPLGPWLMLRICSLSVLSLA